MSSDINTVKADNVSKVYHVFGRPHERLLHVALRRGKPSNEVWALKNVSFTVGKGECFGIVGRNGSGKSTLLEIITGTLQPTQGSVSASGRIAALLELGAGFNPEFSGRDNAYLNALLLGVSRSELQTRLPDILEFAEIGEFIDRPVKTYSSGMYVRLAFSIQACLDPDILIVDEALAVGDAYFVQKCMARINDLRSRGVTILFVSHDATAVKTLCDRAVWLERGEVKELGQAPDVIDAYLASISRQSRVISSAVSADKSENYPINPLLSSDPETHIPNTSMRFGDQSANITGIGLYNKDKARSSHFAAKETLLLRVTVSNNTLPVGTELKLGISLRNHRGVDIASANSDESQQKIVSMPIGEPVTLRVSFELPRLHPGAYALSVNLNYINKTGVEQNADAIQSAVVFEATSDKPVHVLLGLDCSWMRESKPL
jgi:lipopolysaccharide transport system ATP-binding protein